MELHGVDCSMVGGIFLLMENMMCMELFQVCNHESIIQSFNKQQIVLITNIKVAGLEYLDKTQHLKLLNYLIIFLLCL